MQLNFERPDDPAYRPEIPDHITAFEKVLATACVVIAAGIALKVKLSKSSGGKSL